MSEVTTQARSQSTPLLDVHTGLGARLTDFAGWRMPLKYSSELAEHQAVRTTAGLFDLSHMGEIRVRGPQAAAVLDHALVGKLSAIATGRAKYSLLCDETGGILDDLVTYRLAEDEYLVIANASNTEVVAKALAERVRSFEAEVIDETGQTALIAVQGPASAAIVEGLLGTGASVASLQLDKSFVGRQALAQAAPDQPARVLTGLSGQGRRAARAGNSVLNAAGEPIGVITSGALSPTLGRPIALAYLDREEAVEGRSLSVDVRGSLLPFDVTPYPFYRRL